MRTVPMPAMMWREMNLKMMGERWGDRVCPFVSVWRHRALCVCVRVFNCVYRAHWKHQEVVKMNRGVRGGCVCLRFCARVTRRCRPLMAFACRRCEQNDPAVLIKTNGTDRSPLIVFHWQMAPLTPEDCCRGPACLEQTDSTNEDRRSASVCTAACTCAFVYTVCVASSPRCAVARVQLDTMLH